MLPVGPATDGMASRSEEVASAVEGFADEITPIITALTQVKVEAEALVADIEGFTPYVRHDWWSVVQDGLWNPLSAVADEAGAIIGVRVEAWDQDPDLIDRNDDLVRRINDQVAQYENAVSPDGTVGDASKSDHPLMTTGDDAAGLNDASHSGAASDTQNVANDGSGRTGTVSPDSVSDSGDVQSGVDAGATHTPHQTQDAYPSPQVAHEVTWDKPVGRRTPFAQTKGLEPNTLYHVEGRGDFYTDADGTVRYIDTHWGTTGARNPDLQKPAPDATYVIHRGDDATYVYQTDSQSRTILAAMDNYRPVAGGERSASIQAKIGHLGGSDYQGGHLIAASRGAGADDIGTVPQLTSLNTGGGDYWTLEKYLDDTWSDLQKMDPGSTIDFKVELDYTGDSKVLNSFIVQYRINGGDWERRPLSNVE